MSLTPIRTAPVQAIVHIRGGRIVEIFPALFLKVSNEGADDLANQDSIVGSGFQSFIHAEGSKP